MIQFLLDWAARTPDAPVFIGPRLTITYGELLRATQAAAAWLYECGVRQGDIVALSLEDKSGQTERALSLFYALIYLGAPILPLYPGVPAAMCGPVAARFKARWLIAGASVAAPAGCPRLDPAAYDRKNDRWRAVSVPRGDDPTRPLRYEFTSGTTGDPKVFGFTGAQYAAIAYSNVKCFGWKAGDRLLPVAPWPGKVGLRGLAQMTAAGGALVNVPFPDTRAQLADLIEKFGVTCIRSVPWQLRRLLASEAPPRWPSPPLRFLEVAGAFITPREIRAVRNALTPALRVSYGSSESGVMAHLSAEEPDDAAPVLVSGMEGQAVDDADRPVPAGVAGRLRFRASWLPTAYIANDKATAERFRDGWYYPGDAGSIDAEGRVTLRGRTDGVINHGGSKILPRDIEQVLEQYPDVAEAVVIGVTHPLKGEVPVAFVVPRRSFPARAVWEFCSARIEGFQLPALILMVENIPRSGDGKILRSHLQGVYDEWARQYLETGSGSGA